MFLPGFASFEFCLYLLTTREHNSKWPIFQKYCRTSIANKNRIITDPNPHTHTHTPINLRYFYCQPVI